MTLVQGHNYLGPVYKHGSTFTPEGIGNHMAIKGCDKITYPFPNYNCRITIEYAAWYHSVSNFTYRFI